MGSDEAITIPLWAVLLVLLVIVVTIAAVILFAAALSAVVALLLRRSDNDWIRSRAICRMSFEEVVIALAAATTVAAPLGVVVGLYQWSLIAFITTTWIVSLPISVIILFDGADRSG